MIITDLIDKLTEAIPIARNVDPYLLHEQVAKMYNWDEVAERTEKVYDRMSASEPIPLIDQLKK